LKLGTTVNSETTNSISHSKGNIQTDGDVQTNQVLLYNAIDASGTENLYTNGSSSEIIVSDGTSIGFEIHLVARSTNGTSSFRKYEGLVKNVSGSMTVVGTVETIVAEDLDVLDMTISAASGKLSLQVTNQLGEELRVSAYARWTQIIY